MSNSIFTPRLLGLCLFLILQTALYSQNLVDYSSNKEYTIAGLKVSGTKYLDGNALLSIAGLKVGDKINIPGDDISQAIRNLWRQGILGDVKINLLKVVGEEAYLELVIQEKERLSTYYITGVRKGQVSTLKDKLGRMRGKMVSKGLVQKAKNIIATHYKDKGFRNTKVSARIEQDTLHKNHTILVLHVNKGKKIRISDISFEGNTVFKARRLRRKLKKTKHKKFMRLFSPSRFIRYEYWNDKDNLRDFYKNKGYKDAKIVTDSVFVTAPNRVAIKIKLEEGTRYYIGDISWSGNFKYSDTVLQKVLGLKTGQVFSAKELEKRLTFNPNSTDITSIYMDDGYLFFNVKPIEKGIRGDTVDLEIRIYEGEQADINKIVVGGNTRTNDHVIYRQLRTLPSYKFSRSQLIRTQRELATLGYFDPETIDIQPQPNLNDGTVDIRFGLTEKSSDELQLSAGIGGNLGFIGTVGLAFNNFSAQKMTNLKKFTFPPTGDGQQLSLRVQANGRQYQNYSISFAEPWLGGRKPNNFNVSLNYTNNRVFGNVFSGPEIGRLDIIGISVGLGRRLTKPDDFFTLSNSLRYNFYNLNNFNGFGAVGFGSFNTGQYHSFNFITNFARNSLDNFVYPRQGSSLSLQVKLTPPYSLFEDIDYPSASDQERFRLIEYAKFIFDGFWYVNIVDKLVLNARFHFGLLTPYTKSKGIGPFERFQLGGDGLTQNNIFIGTDIIGLRGYNNNSIIPIDRETQQPRGGISFAKYVLELRYPLSLNPSATIYLLSFLEGGNNWNRIDDVNPFNLYRSAGVGVRFLLPAFGLLGIDYAVGFNEVIGNPGANGGQLHFTIGQTIR